MDERLMSPADLERVTGYKQYTAQVRWFNRHFGVDVPRRADGSIVFLWTTFAALDARRAGLIPAEPAARERPELQPLRSKKRA
ncbi:DUF4224 domain-containing protein [Burkholderia sp. PR2]|uniref:DUF4224 domain-containing protein n=1 Tax=Burkholderia sp. PR2 TaxID=3448078 RepID=UPI00402AC779